MSTNKAAKVAVWGSGCFTTAAAVAADATVVVQMIQGGKHGLTTNNLCANAVVWQGLQ